VISKGKETRGPLVGGSLALLVVFGRLASGGLEAEVSVNPNAPAATAGTLALIATAEMTAIRSTPHNTAPNCCRHFIDAQCQLAKMKILLLTGDRDHRPIEADAFTMECNQFIWLFATKVTVGLVCFVVASEWRAWR
jgi:hypothetical protein